jgi:alkylated DNA nucleotide flippase Atl1
MKAAQFRMDLQGLSNNMNKQPETPTYSSGLLGATQQFAGNPNAAQLSGILQELLARQEFVENQFLGADGTVVDMNPQKAANMALQEAQKLGLNQADTIQLMNAMYALFGKLGS